MSRRVATPEPEEPMTVILSVKLSDGSFNSSVSVPVNATKERKDAALDQWLKTIQFGLSLTGDVNISHEVSP